jgi:hypothetical protein
MASTHQEKMLIVVEELLKATTQLSSCEERAPTDLEALTRFCAQRLASLQELRSGARHQSSQQGREDPGAETADQIQAMLRALEAATQRCVAQLSKNRTHMENELQNLRHTRKAFRAYHNYK